MSLTVQILQPLCTSRRQPGFLPIMWGPLLLNSDCDAKYESGLIVDQGCCKQAECSVSEQGSF